MNKIGKNQSYFILKWNNYIIINAFSLGLLHRVFKISIVGMTRWVWRWIFTCGLLLRRWKARNGYNTQYPRTRLCDCPSSGMVLPFRVFIFWMARMRTARWAGTQSFCLGSSRVWSGNWGWRLRQTTLRQSPSRTRRTASHRRRRRRSSSRHLCLQEANLYT